MKSALFFFVFIFAACAAFAQTRTDDLGVKDASPESIGAQRSRIQSERVREEAAFSQAQVACYQRFAVTDCLNALRKHRRSALDALRREEVKLNDLERQRKAKEQLEQIRQKSAPE